MQKEQKKYSFFILFITSINTLIFIISNLIEIKVINIHGFTFTMGTFTFPVVYIASDIIQEFCGYQLSRKSSYLNAIFQLFVVFLFYLTIHLPPDPESLWVQSSLENVLGCVPGIVIASIICMLSGDFINDIVFLKIKNKQKKDWSKKNYLIRAYISSVLGRIGDTIPFCWIAFVFLPYLAQTFGWFWLTSMTPISTKLAIKFSLTAFFINNIYELLLSPISIWLISIIRKMKIL
jgi:uncharacterized integral membrane protein (TIGR00697 family)